jgi:hypothetical protein
MVQTAKDAAQMAGIEAQRIDVAARSKRDALEATRALANQQRVLSEEFGKAGATGVRSMDDVRQTIANAANGDEIAALGRALNEAFQQGVLSADEYKQALDDVLAKTKDLKEENKSKPMTVSFEEMFRKYGTDVDAARRASPGDKQGVIAKAYAEWLAAKQRTASGGSESADTSTAEGYFQQQADNKKKQEAARTAEKERQAAAKQRQATDSAAQADAVNARTQAAAAAWAGTNPTRTVRVQLVSAGKTTNLDLPEGQDEALLDAIRRSGLAST